MYPANSSPIEQTDQQLIEQVLSGEKDTFAMLITRYQKQIFVYLLRLLNFHQENAEDVLSETFLKAYANLSSYNPRLKFFSWLYRIAHNEAINWLKKNQKQAVITLEDIHPDTLIDFDNFDKLNLEKILNLLPVDDKNLLILFYLEERSIKEISEILKITENNVKVRLNRAKNKARDLATKYKYKKE